MAIQYDALTGLPKRSGQFVPDSDPTGQYGLGSFAAAPSLGGGISPSSPGGGYAGLLNIPGTQPDFMGVLNSDPFLQQARSGFGAQSIADRAQLTAAQRQALVRYGLIPENLTGDFADAFPLAIAMRLGLEPSELTLDEGHSVGVGSAFNTWSSALPIEGRIIAYPIPEGDDPPEPRLWGPRIVLTPAFAEHDSFLLGRSDFFKAFSVSFEEVEGAPRFHIETPVTEPHSS